MEQNNFIGISIDENCILGLNGYIKEDILVIDDAMSMQRHQTVKKDCASFIQRFSLEEETVGVAAIGDYRNGLMEIPHLTLDEMKNALQWQLEDSMDWEKGSYYADFMTKNKTSNEVSDTNTEELLYWAALPKQRVDDLAMGFFNAPADIRQIDYWPAPLHRVFEERGAKAIGWYTERGITISTWQDDICYGTIQPDRDQTSILEALKTLEQQLFLYNFSGLEGIYIYDEIIEGGLVKKYEKCEDEISIWGSIYNQYGMLSKRDCHYINRAASTDDTSQALWDVALGIVIKGLGVTSYD